MFEKRQKMNKLKTLKYLFGDIMRQQGYNGSLLENEDETFTVFVFNDTGKPLIEELIPQVETAEEIMVILRNNNPQLFL